MFEQKDKIIVLEDWPQPEAGAPMPQIVASDINFSLQYFTPEEKIAVIVFPLVNTFIFGSPNDETLTGHPLYKNGLQYYCVHEVLNSSWLRKLEKQNSIHPNHNPKKYLHEMKHYIFTFHDSTLECATIESQYQKTIIKTVSSNDEAKEIIQSSIRA